MGFHAGVIYIYTPNRLCCRGSGGVSSVLGIAQTAFDAHAVTKSCAQARQTVMVTSLPCTRNHSPPSLLCAGAYDMTHSDSKMSLASWVPPGCPRVPSGCFLGASWVPRRPKITQSTLFGVSRRGHYTLILVKHVLRINVKLYTFKLPVKHIYIIYIYIYMFT